MVTLEKGGKFTIICHIFSDSLAENLSGTLNFQVVCSLPTFHADVVSVQQHFTPSYFT